MLEAETTNAKKLARTEIFYDGLDRTINEIQERFSSQTSKLLLALCDVIKNNNPKEESYDIVAEFYLIDKAILKAEKEIFHNLLANLNYSCETPTKVAEQMQLDCLNETLPQLWKVVHIMATIPATSCSAERSFSCL